VIVAEFIASCRTTFGIPHAIACRALGVSQSWFYKWINRMPTVREQRRARLDEEIKKLFTASGGTYGSLRITRDLRVGRCRRTPWLRGWPSVTLGAPPPPDPRAPEDSPEGLRSVTPSHRRLG
jgi:hypothetical protein